MSPPSQSAHAAHFASAAQEAHAHKLGMWVFLGSETLLFAGLLALYFGYRVRHEDAFVAASGHNSVPVSALMTVSLLVSSFLVAWSVHCVQRGRRRAALGSLVATVSLGAGFLGLKGYEYAGHFAQGIYPGARYAFEPLPGEGANLYFTLYYFLTALHALHVIAGIVLIAVLAVMLRRGYFTPERHTALANGGLYWHLVDIIWLLLWPMLYLG